MATVSFSPAGDVLYAYLAGEIDHDAAQSLRIQLDDALVSRAPQTMILDFGGVGFMDSSGVGLILGRQRIARTLGTALRVQHTPSQLEKVLQLARIPCTDAGQKEVQQHDYCLKENLCFFWPLERGSEKVSGVQPAALNL